MNQDDDPGQTRPATMDSASDHSAADHQEHSIDLDRLRTQFDSGVTLALMEAVSLCAKRREGAPVWVVDGLEKHRAKLIAALSAPPPQTVSPPGIFSEWLGRPEFEKVDAGKGESIVQGRRSGEVRRISVEERDQSIVVAYQATLLSRSRRHGAVSAAYSAWKRGRSADVMVSLKQFSNIIRRDVKDKKRRR